MYRVALLLVPLSLLMALVRAEDAPRPYRFIQQIDIGGAGNWDYLSVDAGARRLYVTHGDAVEVIDLDRGHSVGRVGGTAGVHGVAIAADLGRGFTSNGADSSVTEFDLASLKVLHKITTGSGPDAIVYESGRRQIYTFDGRAQAATVIDARAARVLTQIALPDRPEFAVADAARGRVFDAIVDRDLIVAIDTQTHAVVASWPTPPCHGPSALALDGVRHRLFVGCHNQTLLMMDDADGRILASMPIGRGVDATAYDAGTGLVFSANGEGTVSVALAAANALQLVQTLRTQPGARTLALDPNTHRLYLAVADRAAGAAPPPTPGVGFRGPPPTVPGTFKLLVYGME